MQHTALNHAWLAAVVCGGWGLLLTTWRPSASSRRLNVPYHAPSPCFLLPSPLQDCPEHSPLPMPCSLIYALYVLRLLQEAAAGAAGGGGGRRGMCVGDERTSSNIVHVC